MAKSKYNLILIPEGASLPEDLQPHLFSGSDVIEKVGAGLDGPKIVAVNTRELQMIVEYRDLFDLDTVAVIGLQGAMYNTIWNTYVATMKRTTLDALRVLFKEGNDARSSAGNDRVVAPSREDRLARLGSLTAHPNAPAANAGPDDEADFSGDGAT